MTYDQATVNHTQMQKWRLRLEHDIAFLGLQRKNFVGRRRLGTAILSAVALPVAIYVLVILFRAAPRAPFYCSTWDSAVRVPDDLKDAVRDDFEFWSNDHEFEELFPSPDASWQPQPPPQSSEELLSDKPKNVAGAEWKKPEGFQVVAMIFFGRPHQVDILDCYLQQNMAYNGGFLDEVHFIAHTTDGHALAWLDNLVAATPSYTRTDVGPNCFSHPHSKDCRYERIWERFATDPNTLYIKIDDDIVYIHPETIPRIVIKRLEHPHPYAISANLVNSPITSWLHYHTGAIYPFLPEPSPIPRHNPPTWRTSELPLHPRDKEFYELEWGPTPDDSIANSAMKDDDALYKSFGFVFPGHRWLPLSQNSTSILHTPMSRASLSPWGPSVHSWAIAAQQHYSLLQNIENDTMHRYWVAPVPPTGTGLWNMQYVRYNLNFIAVWGRDIVLGANVRRVSGPTEYTPEDATWTTGLGDEWGNGIVSNMHDDEKNITVDIPRILGRPMMIDVQALAAHMHFHDQEVGIQMTDLLDRYRAYVNENVCSPRRRKGVPGQVGGLGWNEEIGGAGWWKCPWVR